MVRALPLAAISLVFLAGATAQTTEQGFVKGPVFTDFGPAAPVESDLAIPEDLSLQVAFDISEASGPDTLNRQFNTVARFINMHAGAGVPLEQIRPAVVVHGGAASHLLRPETGEADATGKLIMALIEQDVPVYLCGQTMAARGIAKEDLLPGVKVALSAMTAHAILADEGYSLNPF